MKSFKVIHCYSLFKEVQERLQSLSSTRLLHCTVFKMTNPMIYKSQSSHFNETKSPTLQKSGLTMAILRYQNGEERFEFTFKYQDKIFNFNRPVSETLQNFIERARSNIMKKIKQFDPNSQIICEVKNIKKFKEERNSDEFIFSNIFHPDGDDIKNNFENINLTFQIGNETVPVNINPPEIFKIKFFKNIMVGFPILPIILEGSPGFVPENSMYKWEFANVEDVLESNQKRLRKKSESEKQIWNTINNNHHTNGNFPIFTPDSSMLGSILRLTCTPSNQSKDKQGNLFSVNTSVVTNSPTSKYLFDERLSRMDPKSINPNWFRVITYNVLSDHCATEEWFTKSPKDSLPMDYRLPILNFELKSYQGDIICMQEVDKKYFESYYKPFLSQECGLDGILCCKTGEKTNREGVATFFNPQKFELIDTNSIILHEYMKTLPFYKQIQNEKLCERLTDRSTVLQVCIFKSLGSPDTLILVGNTHLYFHPDADHIRLLQTITCVNFIESKIEELKIQFPKMKTTVIFCGDFNCTPPYGSYRFLTSGKVDKNDEDWTSHDTEKLIPGIELEHKLNLINSHPGYELTNIVGNFEGCIDYILYQKNSIQLIKNYPPPSKENIIKFCSMKNESQVCLPNFQAGSDHLPVIVDFCFKI